MSMNDLSLMFYLLSVAIIISTFIILAVLDSDSDAFHIVLRTGLILMVVSFCIGYYFTLRAKKEPLTIEIQRVVVIEQEDNQSKSEPESREDLTETPEIIQE